MAYFGVRLSCLTEKVCVVKNPRHERLNDYCICWNLSLNFNMAIGNHSQLKISLNLHIRRESKVRFYLKRVLMGLTVN